MIQSQAFQQWMSLHIPDPAEQKVALERFVSQGSLDPKLETAIKQDPSEFQKIVTDPGDKAAQNRSLSALEDIGNNGGLRLQDKATLQDSMLHGQAQERANREGINAEMARRGLGGSGYDVAAKLQGQQTVADEQSNAGLKAAAAAQDRALQSIQGAGTLATQYRTQDFGEQAKKADSADQINRFNTTNAQNVNASNVQAQNRASEMNLAAKQKTADQNTQLSNQEQMYNKNLSQQYYDNQVRQAQGATNQTNAMANTAERGGQQEGNAISNVGTAGANAFTVDNYYNHLDDYLTKKKALTGTPGGG